MELVRFREVVDLEMKVMGGLCKCSFFVLGGRVNWSRGSWLVSVDKFFL